jgi:Xaa-Pro aminopeptidase
VLSPNLEKIQEAIRSEGLDGWLFCNFHHRDVISDEILGRTSGVVNSRFWFYLVPALGKPLKIVHAVEPLALEGLPGEEKLYVSREELSSALKTCGGKTWGAQISEKLPAVSFLDAGTAVFLEKAGLALVSAAGLIQRLGLLDGEGIASHEKAAVHLYEIVAVVWDKAKASYSNGKILWEGDLRSFMLEEMERRDLVTDHNPIIAAGKNAGNPHYDFDGSGSEIRRGDVVQFDLWAKGKKAGRRSVYADISWVGFYGEKIPAETEKNFAALLDAREGALTFIGEELAAGRKISGAMVDKKTREILVRSGYEKNLKHRTGHGIDTEVHGSGVNIDSVEFPDERLLLEGSCFSLEPGIYFEDCGFRTEIDVYIRDRKPVVSGGSYGRQFALLHC